MDESGDQKGSNSLKLDLNVDCGVESRDEEDEDEDVDFNPFVSEACSPEASSSLSSEIEERDLEGDTTEYETGCIRSEAEERVSRGLVIGGERVAEYEENMASVSQAETEILRDGEMGLVSGTDVAEYETAEELETREDARNPVYDEDDDVGAICKRTRARYSLASFTLDELETFLQETDDEDDLPNSDDEEVYRKFLAAVLLGGDGDGKGDRGNQVVDDEDEENDADFELEIEEALESDTDERIQEKEKDEARRRPETRQNKRKRTPLPVKDSVHLQSLCRPLRPLVPLPPLPSAPLSLSTTMDTTITPTCLSSSADNFVKNGFTPHQLGQFHCIIYEHIQLLIQVFTLSVFDPARHHIASQVQGLLMDFINKRDQALASKKDHHPVFCFSPPYLHPSVPCELSQTWPIQFPSVQTPLSDSFGQVPTPDVNIAPFTEERLRNEGLEDTSKQKKRLLWLPQITGPLYSVLDVAPLSLVGKYMHDVKIAMQDYQQRFLRDTCDTQFECESMFPSFLDPNVGCCDTATGNVSFCSEGSSSLPSQKLPKKPLVAELIENSKKQPVALVPRLLSKLALRFFTLFNPALYPRKPPPIIIANRFLFTTAEDELLALGMMEYNTDWKAIQQRFLPCKSKHQIFVRQKNCCTSKAPENPIKAVRRMKTSPLTVDEVARIREGLKIFKLDWFSIWKFIVPYRDPSLLARQWRIALGTQKSYKSDSVNKERRRLYEANRRQAKAESRNLSEKRDKNNSAHDSIDNEDVAFVHETFLADWRPRADASISSHIQTNQPSISLLANYQANIQNGPDQPKGSYYTPGAISSSKSTFCSRPYRARRSRNAQMVKLAPGLPALNLPPSVRVMSQSAFKSYHPVASAKVSTTCSGGVPNVTPIRLSFTSSGASVSNMGLANLTTSMGKSVANSRDDSSSAYLEMHPLLFQSSGDGTGLPYHPLKFTSGTSSSFTFFNANQSQASGSHFHREQDGTTGSLYSGLQADGTTSVSCGIDFHPLLQRTDDAECSARNPLSSVQANLSLELLNELGVGNISNLHEKANQLNLEIQLSSSPRERQLRKSTEATDNIESRITSKETMNPPSSPIGSNSLPFFLGSNTNARSYRMNLAGEQSMDIVMEQEELSDSDEEDNDIEEDIEFEREEMTDSEPDAASDFESVVQTQNKEVNTGRKTLAVPGNRSEENGLTDGSRFHPCLTLNLASQDNDIQKCGKNQRPRKKRTPVRKRGRGAANDPPSVPLTLGSLLEVHPKKPRKRVCKSKLRLDTLAAECSGSVNN